MQDTLVTFVRQGTNRVGCVVARCNHGVVSLGWSKCMTKPTKNQREQGIKPDRFDKNEALQYAKDRANLTLGDVVTQATQPAIPAVCRKALRKMADRARRYFKGAV